MLLDVSCSPLIGLCIPLTEPVVCLVTALTSSGGTAAALAETEADRLVPCLGCLEQSVADWSRGLG